MITDNLDGTYTVTIFDAIIKDIRAVTISATLIHDYTYGKIVLLDGIPHRAHELRKCGYLWQSQTGQHSCQTWVAAGFYCQTHETLARARVQRVKDLERENDSNNLALQNLDKNLRKKYPHLSDEDYNRIFNSEIDLGDD